MKHALIRIVERNINIYEIEECLLSCKILKEYAEDKPRTSYLVMGNTNKNKILHIVLAIDLEDEYIYIITVYEPDKNKWDKTFKREK